MDSPKVGMLILMESDIQAAVEFYKKIGLTLKFNLDKQWAEFTIGPVKLALCATSHEPFERHTGIVLEIEDLNAFERKLKEEGINLFRDPIVAPHGIMASLKDPSGNIIDLYQPTPETLDEFVKTTVSSDK